MRIRTRLCVSLDGCVTRPDGWPVQLADPSFVPGQSLGALDLLGLILLPLLAGDGMRLTPALSPGAGLTLETQRALPEGAVEITYRCTNGIA